MQSMIKKNPRKTPLICGDLLPVYVLKKLCFLLAEFCS
jgi:hypothetical protein